MEMIASKLGTDRDRLEEQNLPDTTGPNRSRIKSREDLKQSHDFIKSDSVQKKTSTITDAQKIYMMSFEYNLPSHKDEINIAENPDVKSVILMAHLKENQIRG